MKLYEIAESYRNLQELLEDETIPVEVVNEALQQVEGEFEYKAENIIKLIKSLEGEIAVYKEEEKRMASNRKALEAKTANLKDYLLNNMQGMNKKEVKAGLFKLKIARNPVSLKIEDESKIPTQFVNEVVTKVIDKTAIKEALKSGEIIEGCSLEQGERLNIK